MSATREPTYPGTDDVLVNRFGIKDQETLNQRERQLTTQRFRSLPAVVASSGGLKDVHRHLFKDVYEWAGNFRLDDPWLGLPDGATVQFAPAETIEGHVAELFEYLAAQSLSATAGQFADRAARTAGVLNKVHPFREGNGRTMRAFLSDWSRQQGHEVAFNSWTTEQWMDSSIAAYHGNYSIMRETIGLYLQRGQ